MFLLVPNVLDEAQLSHLIELISAEQFVDGSATASGGAAQAKHNLQLPPESEKTQAAGAYLMDCLRTHPLLQLAVQPRAFVQPLFSRYEPGMRYGNHLDAPILHRGQTIRSDISMTVFLSRRADYDGGELVIEVGTEHVSIKGDAGDCVVYPTTSIHRVAEVTRGVRMVSALWAQSVIRSSAQREILYDLGCALQFYETTGSGGPYVDRLRKSYGNLVRLWAEI